MILTTGLLAWPKTSTIISAEEKNGFCFFHLFHSFKQKKATIKSLCHISILGPLGSSKLQCKNKFYNFKIL